MRRLMRRGFAIILFAVLIAIWAFPEWFGLASRPTRSAAGDAIVVRDGDTLTIGDRDVRLHGIDAPEFTQSCKTATGIDWPCGRDARLALVQLVKGHVISCEDRATDKYGRTVATCRDDQGRDLARAMAEQGLAVSFGGFAEGPYADDEAAAKQAKRGVWQGTFDPPSSWRESHPRHRKDAGAS